MARMTIDERRQRALVDREMQEALAFRDVVAAVNAQEVVATSGDLFRMPALRARIGEKLTDALYRALSETERHRAEYLRELEYAAARIAELQRNAALGRFYHEAPNQRGGADLNTAYGRFHAAADAAESLCRACDVHCPALDEAADAKRRATIMSLSVDDDQSGQWVVRVDGLRAEVDGMSLPCYAEEWLAWRAAATLR